jgi:hypothetical protein
MTYGIQLQHGHNLKAHFPLQNWCGSTGMALVSSPAEAARGMIKQLASYYIIANAACGIVD